jgi:succinoglycan biosynthesis protein ExoA
MGERVPQISVIVPTPDLNPPPPVLEDLVAIQAERPGLEILVAIGTCPSRQRNLAVQAALGEVVVFLDADCRVSPEHFDRALMRMGERCDVVGGPVLLEEPSTWREQLFQRLLGHPLLTGASCARYRVFGTLRPCGDAELILCNMVTRRVLFLESGGFDETLYPNEENEWMTRIQGRGAVCWHDPGMAVRRPQRKTWRSFAFMLMGYGRGRTKQFLVSRQFDPVRQAPVVALFVWVLVFLFFPVAAIVFAVLGWIGFAVASFVTLGGSSSALSAAAAASAPVIPFFYAIGQMIGFFSGKMERLGAEVRVIRWEISSRTDGSE